MPKHLEYFIDAEIEKMIDMCCDEFKDEYTEFIGIINDIRKNELVTSMQLVELENMYNFNSPMIEYVFKHAFYLGIKYKSKDYLSDGW